MRIGVRISMRMARPTTGTTGTPTNLYLNAETKAEARRIAKTRYGISLSELVQRLILAEMAKETRRK